MSTLVHPDAWDYLVTHYLRPVQPPFSVSYRDMVRAAEHYGWSPIPSLRALRLRMDKDIPVAAQLAARTAHKPRRVTP